MRCCIAACMKQLNWKGIKMKCFYHSSDLDGHCSGAIIKKFNPDAELIGYNYGQAFPWDTIEADEVVFMVDVSLEIDDMVNLSRVCGRLVWIDHHIGIIRDFNALSTEQRMKFYGHLDTSMAACELCWNYCTDDMPMPDAVRLLGVYDSWRFTPEQEAEVKAFQYGMRCEKETRPEKSMDFWDGLLRSMLDVQTTEIQNRGNLIFKYQLAQNVKTCRSGAFITVLHYGKCEKAPAPPALVCVAVNSNLMNSDVFRSVYNPEEHDAMLCFYRSNKGFWRCSIYSTKENVDCSIYAKSYGGGGHKGAAGFQVESDTLPFILSSKKVNA